jgi:hypothetical protein
MTTPMLLSSAEAAFSRGRDADLDANERLFTLIRNLAADIEGTREWMARLRTRIEQLEARGSGGET